MKKLKTQQGITLVALIITIVVLLILAVVSIGAVQNSGIIGHAQQSAEGYTQAKNNEVDGVSDYETFIKVNSEEFIVYNDKEKAEITDSLTKAFISTDENEKIKAVEILTNKYKMDVSKVISVKEEGESEFYYYLCNIGTLIHISYSGSASSFGIEYKDIDKEKNNILKEVYEICCLFDKAIANAQNVGPIEIEFKGEKITMSYSGYWSFSYKGFVTMANGGNSDNYGNFVGM